MLKDLPTNRKGLTVAVLLFFVLAGTVFALEKAQIINLYSKKTTVTDPEKTTSTTKTAQEDFTEGDYREPGNSLSENRGSGAVIDNNGNIENGTDTSLPLVSDSGEISLFSPKANAIVNSGTSISGASTLPKVSYRLIDSVSGVLAMGDLNVVQGKFSGTLSFSTSATEGRLDIFGTKSDGTEFSNLEVMIRFAND